MERAAEIVESVAKSDDATWVNDVDNDATCNARICEVVESAFDRMESTAESEDARLDTDVDNDATPEVLS